MKQLANCYLLILLLLPTNALFAQSKESLVQIPGTKFFIQLPDSSFKIANAYMGIVSTQYNIGISIVQWPERFDAFQTDFKKTLAKANVLIDTFYSTNKRRSRLIKFTIKEESWLSPLKDSPKMSWLYMVEDDTSTVLLGSSYAIEKDKLLSNLIKPAIISFRIVDSIQEDPLAQLPFSFDISNSTLKFTGSFILKGAAFNLSGKQPNTKIDTINLLLYPMNIVVENTDTEKFADTEKEILSNLEKSILYSNQITISNKKGYEIISKDKDAVLYYNAYLFDEDATYYIRGESKKGHMRDIETIQKVIRTIKIK